MVLTNSVHIGLPGGDHLEAVMSYPDGVELAPGLIVAPGSGYPKEGPLIVELCEQATAAGFITLRFDWRYTSTGGRPSSNRKRELEDLQAVLSYVESIKEIDPRRLVLAGKSLGAGVAYQAFRSRPDIFAALLLTPVFRDSNSGPRNYPDLPHERRPVYLLTGSSDPLNKRSVMQDYLHAAAPNVLVRIVEGNHGFEVSRARSPEAASANRDNIRGAVGHAADWLREIIE
ncbi:dienelactone hydrolase family protein [Candidatus Neomarinimicrobiota bacterium]